MSYILGVLLYVVREREVLLMHRNKEPNLGLWIAPGGKVELGESPYEAARREMLEETGLQVTSLQLRGLCTEVSPFEDWHWLLFVFMTTHYEGTLCPDRREGDVAWVPIETYLRDLPIPQADAIFAPRILKAGQDVFQARFVYGEDLKLVEWVEH